ncbi:HpcH/HpaI aldolase family protein [Kribbella pittospori]|uniref:HpcH/HpaI aldolase family protein n=1 Tax=Kribbella pittospori TaxID=722689 RepID=UPI0013F47948|nr:aldolase/citrate lyase family protein [Kribbella pittospori]
MTTRRPLREVLADPTTRLTATFLLIPRLELVELLANAGFDAVVIDLEHGPVAVAELPGLVAAGHGAGVYVLARLGERTPATIGGVLDSGVDGVVLPHVDSADDARDAVDSARFPPEGSRSLNPYVRAAGYDAAESFLTTANAGVAVLVMVEGKDGLAALDDIASVAGVDAVFVGPVDLSASLGLPGEPEHPVVLETVRDLMERLALAGVGTGIYCPTPDAAARWQRAGARLATLSADIAMASAGFRRTVEELHDLNTEGRSR